MPFTPHRATSAAALAEPRHLCFPFPFFPLPDFLLPLPPPPSGFDAVGAVADAARDVASSALLLAAAAAVVVCADDADGAVAAVSA